MLREALPPNLSELIARMFCPHARKVEVSLAMGEPSQARYWHEKHIEEGGQP